MKGIVLAGGSNSRLYPLTLSVSKHLLPVYDKPMIYYPLSVLMLAGIRDILLITNPNNESQYQRLLGSGESFGINISYASQEKPEGIAQAFLIGEQFIGNDTVSLILGDNIFFGQSFGKMLRESSSLEDGAYIFGYPVSDPERFGVVEIDGDGRAISLEEKPKQPKQILQLPGYTFMTIMLLILQKQLNRQIEGSLK